MGATATHLMTFEEFQELPDEVCRRSELRHGELVTVADPLQIHVWLQSRLIRLLDRRAEPYGSMGMEVPFQPRPEYEYYRVDVAFISAARWRPDRNTRLQGSPELVIEILSPSNTAAEMKDRRHLFLQTGCLEFWEIDYDLRLIDVSSPDGITTTYCPGQSIPLPLFGGETLAVDEIFAGLS